MGIFTCLFFGFFVAVIGWEAIANTPRLSAHARILKSVVVVETILVVVYPAFNAAFQVLHGAQQLAFLLVLFLLKVVMRFVMAIALRRGRGTANVAERWRARLPEVVVFSTELFHVLYLTACLQGNHVTIWATIGLAMLDAIGSMISVHYLLRRPSVMLTSTRVSEKLGPSQHSISVIVPVSGSRVTSSARLRTINSSASLHISSRRHTSSISLSASRRLSVAFASSASLLKLAKRSSSRSSRRSNESASRSAAPHLPIVDCSSLQPLPQLTTKEIAAQVSRLRTLSMTEYFLLVEYVKCIIPAMYGVFQFVVSGLPNAAYYPSLANATPLDLHQAQTNVLVFVSLEIFSLMAFALQLYRRLHFSVLHQLAFVLETAADDIQAKLAMFIPYCFFFFLKHNGVDYSFQFAWLDQS